MAALFDTDSEKEDFLGFPKEHEFSTNLSDNESDITGKNFRKPSVFLLIPILDAKTMVFMRIFFKNRKNINVILKTKVVI